MGQGRPGGDSGSFFPEECIRSECFFPIDLVFLSKDKKVVHLGKLRQPKRVSGEVIGETMAPCCSLDFSSYRFDATKTLLGCGLVRFADSLHTASHCSSRDHDDLLPTSSCGLARKLALRKK